MLGPTGIDLLVRLHPACGGFPPLGGQSVLRGFRSWDDRNARKTGPQQQVLNGLEHQRSLVNRMRIGVLEQHRSASGEEQERLPRSPAKPLSKSLNRCERIVQAATRRTGDWSDLALCRTPHVEQTARNDSPPLADCPAQSRESHEKAELLDRRLQRIGTRVRVPTAADCPRGTP